MRPQYPIKAARAIGYLKKPFNDIEVFVEDTSLKNAYIFYIRRMLPKNIRLASVTQLGPRERVIEACRNDQIHDGRRKIYLIDADMDFLLGKPKPRLKFLYRLRAYCFENLILENEALIQVAMISSPEKDEQDLRAEMSLEMWVPKIAAAFSDLYVLYATAQAAVQTGRPINVTYPVQRLCQSTNIGFEPDRKLIRRHYINLRTEIVKLVDIHLYRSLRKQVLEGSQLSGLPWTMLVSGKNHLLPLVLRRIKCIARYHGSKEQLIASLAFLGKKFADPYLRNAVRVAAK